MNGIIKKIILLMVFLIMPFIIVSASDLEIMPIEYVNGDCTLLKSGNEYLLIDVGTSSSGVTLSELNKKGITKDTPINLYLSHYHDDHYGGGYTYKMNLTIDNNESEYNTYLLGYLMANYNVKKIYLPKPYFDEVNTETNVTVVDNMKLVNNYYKIFNAVAEMYNVNVITLERGSKFLFGNTTAEVLYLDRDASYQNKNTFLNNSSLVTMFKNGNIKFLTAGDLQHEVEEEILSENIDISADIFKLSHHGCYDTKGNYSNIDQFIDAVSPKYFYAQIRHSFLKYNHINGSLPKLLTYSNMYSNIDISNFEDGQIVTNGNIKFIILDDEITPIMEKNSHRVTIKYIDKETNEIIYEKYYDFSSTEKYYLYDYKKVFTGYTLSSGEEDIVQTGILSSDVVYNIYYNKNSYMLTVKHINENGEVLYEEQKDYKYKQNYITLPDDQILLEYDLIRKSENTEGVIENNTTVIYTYKQKAIVTESKNNSDKTDEELEHNVKTGDVLIVFVWIIGIGTFIYSIYYFIRLKK